MPQDRGRGGARPDDGDVGLSGDEDQGAPDESGMRLPGGALALCRRPGPCDDRFGEVSAVRLRPEPLCRKEVELVVGEKRD